MQFRTNGDSQADLPRESHIQEYLTTILRGKWIILSSLVLITGATAFITMRMKPVYEATALVLVDMKGRQSSLPFFDMGSMNFNKITNELEILKSRSTAEAVVDALMNRRYLDGPGSGIIPILQKMVDGKPTNTIADHKTIALRALASVSFMPIRDSDIIKVTATSNNPLEAALLANTYTKVYLERNISTSRTRSRAVREFLQEQLESKKKDLDSAEQALQGYMKNSGIVSLDGKSDKVVSQLSELEAARDAVGVEIRSRQKTLASYKEQLLKQEPNVAQTIGESSDTYIKLLQEELAKLEVQRDVVIAQNPGLAGQSIYSDKLKEIEGKITALKRNLQQRTKSFIKTLGPGGSVASVGSAEYIAQVKQKIIEQQIELAALEAKQRALETVIQDYERQFNQIPEKSIELAKLQRARMSNEKLYLLVEEKFNESAITEKSEFGYVDIIDPAVVPSTPVSPNFRKNVMLGALVGLMFGVGIVLLRGYLDVRVRTPEDLKRFGFVSLSAINRMTEELAKQKELSSAAAEGMTLAPQLVTYHNPLSSLSEAYRRLRTNVFYAQMDAPLKSLLVTSANPSEGKSTTIANLAIAFAQAEKRVLLVDADMRRPTIHSTFGLAKNPGITDLFVGTASFEEAVNANVIDNLNILCCGTTPPNPAELLGSKRMQDFIKQMITKYDLVLFDSPPLLAVTDAAVLSTVVDGVILVVSADNTRAAAIHRASEFLMTVGGKVLGVVLNNFDARKAYGGYYGGYGYGYYGYNYGYYSSTGNGNGKRKNENSKKWFKIGKEV